MASFVDLPTVGTSRLDGILEGAIQASWDELISTPQSGSIQVEYQIEGDDSLQYLKIWTSTKRGCWHLVCEQWLSEAWSHVPGLEFSKGYYSEALAHFLELIARHQKVFISGSGKVRNGLVQISSPTEEESREARRLIADVIAVLGCTPVEQLVTAWTDAQTDESKSVPIMFSRAELH